MKKILLLEDNPLDADLVQRELIKRWSKVELSIVSRIEDARKLMNSDSLFDIAIFDLKLPDGNGLELLIELRNQGFQIPILAYTGSGSEEIATSVLKAGANDYIQKKPGFHLKLANQLEFTLNQSIQNRIQLNVLYVEHQTSDIELTIHYFKKNAPHINITTIPNGDLSLNLLPKNSSLPSKYDVILLDYKLPGLNALEIIKIIRQERKLIIPIVIVTGQGNEDLAAKALKIGADDYVVKSQHYLLRLPSVITSAFKRGELEREKHALKQSEIKFRLLADYTSDWEYWVNPQKEYIYNSPVCEKTTGYSKEAFVKNKNLLSEITHPDYKELVHNHFSGKENSLHKPIKFKIITADGKEKWISHICTAVFDDDNNYRGQRGENRDITELKRAETIQNIILNISNASEIADNLSEFMEVIRKELGRVVDTSNFFIALYNEENDTIHLPYYKDEKDDIVDFSAGKTLTGYVIKKGKSFLLDKAEINKLTDDNVLDVVGENPEIWLGVPLKIKGKVTGAFVVQSYINPDAYTEKDKEILEIVSNQISISIERKRQEENLLKALEQAKESDRLKSAFLANMSHEIRTPMNGILGFSELLKTQELNTEKQQKYIDIIEKSGKRMLSTINDIMDISKIEAGQMTISISEFNINEKSEELYSFFKPEAKRKDLEFIFENKLKESEAFIKSDANKIYSVLLNLIKNAIKFTPQGKIEFGYKLKGTNLEFFVKDTGIGIPKDRQEAIFNRFVQADIEDKAAFEGSGLGLAISKSYVDMLGGKIWITSEEGKGSQFYFTIPLNQIFLK